MTLLVHENNNEAHSIRVAVRACRKLLDESPGRIEIYMKNRIRFEIFQ